MAMACLRCPGVLRLGALAGQELLVSFIAWRLPYSPGPEDEELVSVHPEFRGAGDDGEREQRRGGIRGDPHGLELPGSLLGLARRGCLRLSRLGRLTVWSFGFCGSVGSCWCGGPAVRRSLHLVGKSRPGIRERRSDRRDHGRAEVFGDVRGPPAQLAGHRVEPGQKLSGLPLRRLTDRGGLAGRLLGYRGRLAFRGLADRGGIVLRLSSELGRLVVGLRVNPPGRPNRLPVRGAAVAGGFLPAEVGLALVAGWFPPVLPPVRVRIGCTMYPKCWHGAGRMVGRELDPRNRRRRMIWIQLGRRCPVLPITQFLPRVTFGGWRPAPIGGPARGI